MLLPAPRNLKNYYLVLLVGAVVLGLGYAAASTTEGSTVNVTATVNSSVSCATDNSTVAFGTLTTGSVGTASPNASTTMTCNAALGCTLNVSDANHGLSTSSPAYTIPSQTATLAAGTEGYGIQATTTATGSGGTLGVPALYNKSGNNVGNLNATSTVIASSTASITNREIVVTHKAAVSAGTQSASYTDTITYSCSGN